MFDFGGALKKLFEQQSAGAARPPVVTDWNRGRLADEYDANPRSPRFAGLDPKELGYSPDTAAGPGRRGSAVVTNRNRMQLGAEYNANPMSRKFQGVDPAEFGYSADTAAGPGRQQLGYISLPTQGNSFSDFLKRYRLNI